MHNAKETQRQKQGECHTHGTTGAWRSLQWQNAGHAERKAGVLVGGRMTRLPGSTMSFHNWMLKYGGCLYIIMSTIEM